MNCQKCYTYIKSLLFRFTKLGRLIIQIMRRGIKPGPQSQPYRPAAPTNGHAMLSQPHPDPQFLPAVSIRPKLDRAGRLSRRVSLAIILAASVMGWWGIIAAVQWFLEP